jgi:hypothetical protein
MNDPAPNDIERARSNHDGNDSPSTGPRLGLIYGLILLALIVAIGFAAMIVLPFYHRR